MLSESEALRYLLKAELISPRSAALDDVCVMDVSRRNRNLKVTIDGRSGYFLKQSHHPHAGATVAWEATIYRLLHSVGGARLTRYVPPMVLFDPAEGTLVLPLLPDARNLREHYLRVGRFATGVGSALGDALAALHDLTGWRGVIDPNPGTLAKPPWVLKIHEPTVDILRHASAANLKLVTIIQEFPRLGEALDRLADQWRTDVLLHFDLKCDNCLLVTSPSATRKLLFLVDWELATVGDASWDVGCVLADYMMLWLSSIPTTPDMPMATALDLARWPLERMHRSIRSFWQTYVSRRRLPPDQISLFLTRSVQYAAARLLQTAHEQMQMAQHLTGTAVLHLQVSMNLLLRPREAALQLMRIPVA